MRAQLRRKGSDEAEESVFVSMTDMTVSFLIILMILLAFFASRFTNDDLVPRQMLEEIQAELTVLTLENARLEQIIDELSLRPAISIEELQMLRAELESALKKIEVLSRRADIAPEELEALRAALEEARHEIISLNETLEQTRASLAASEQQLQAADIKIKLLRQTIKDLEEELARLKAPDLLEEYLVQVAASRRKALEALRDAIEIEFPDLEVVISAESDAIRFQGEGLFASDVRALTVEKRQIVERIAEILDNLLPCYSLGPWSDFDPSCNPGFAVIEAVQIEGHTDDAGEELYNMGLSSGRAVSTYGAMTERVPSLLKHLNLASEPVLSVAGYGENRPVAPNTSEAGRSTNRRIDLRFIMFSPRRSEEIEIIRQSLVDGQVAAGASLE